MSTGAGDLQHRVRFEQRAADANDDRTGEWGEEFTARAKLTWLKGGEVVLQARLEGVQPIVIRVRSSQKTRAITAAWRGVNAKSGAIYDVKSVSRARDDDGDWVDVMVEAKGGEQG